MNEMLLTDCHNKELTDQSASRPMIQVSGLTKSIATATHRVDILRGLDFEIPRSQFVAIMAPSGSGKTTLLGLLAGLHAAPPGTIVPTPQDTTSLAANPS